MTHDPLLLLDTNLRQLERLERMASRRVRNWDQYHYLMSCSCPPDTFVHIRGGLWGDMSWGSVGFTPSASFDLTDSSSTGRTPRFTNAGWYAFYWLSMAYDGSRLYVGGGSTSWFVEYETAGEAEAGAMENDCFQLHNFPPWDYGIPVGCVIVRNDGNTSAPNRFLPIDPMNRGRSYVLRTHLNIAPRNVI